ncbi:DUF4238 domain-containing protein [Pseudoxanthomonas sp. Root65]|uniref:DUF4238 domain-containing protein n=1 Tax=Pseudoxanthomonas sp. Root65 TaxID=1736576 RepID=UPI0009E98C83|nr:DUF4238 domain-containing protein [Pseudoxanthomonas sp. Root65]
MAGRRHHYLPRFLQRPFAFHQKGKHFYVHAHHRTHGSFGTNVMELGQEVDFYGGPDDPSLDDKITAGERQLSITVNKLNQGEQVTSAEMATLVCALGIRTKAMRSALTTMVPALIAGIRAKIQKERYVQRELIRSLHDPAKRRQLIYEKLRKDHGHLSRELQARLYSQMVPRWKSFVLEQEHKFIEEAEHLLELFMDRLESESEKIASKAFLGALSKGPESPLRVQKMMAEMTFEVLESGPDERFILGDCGPVATFSDGKSRLALGAIEEGVDRSMIYLPISPTRCVLARRSRETTPLSLASINQMSAELSHEFFIAIESDGASLATLRQAIGSLVPIASHSDITRLIADDR